MTEPTVVGAIEDAALGLKDDVVGAAVLKTIIETAGVAAVEAVLGAWTGGAIVDESLVKVIVDQIIALCGTAFVAQHLDLWKLARDVADDAEDAKFGKA